MSDTGTELGNGVCEFEKVPPDQLCPSTIRVKVRVGVIIVVRVRGGVRATDSIRVTVRDRVRVTIRVRVTLGLGSDIFVCETCPLEIEPG